MIEASFYFPNERLDAVIEALSRLTERLKPTQFGHDEGVKNAKDLVADGKRFRAFLEKSASGFFLYAESAIYSFGITKTIEVTIYVDGIDAQEAEVLLRALGPIGVTFAYAADDAERKHRNRLVKKASYGIDEAWVGRDWRRYIPGVYWLTLIPESLAEQHGTPLDELKKAAVSADEISPKLWLMRFYDAPENWQTAKDRLDEVCARTIGVFSITAVRPLFEKTTTFFGTSTVLHEWR